MGLLGPHVVDLLLQVLSWALSPVMASWQGMEWTQAVGSPAAFQARFMPLQGLLPNGMVHVRPKHGSTSA